MPPHPLQFPLRHLPNAHFEMRKRGVDFHRGEDFWEGGGAVVGGLEGGDEGVP